MTEQETYDKFFADEEYDLEKCTVVAYSYWSGWNSALKRAAILISDEIRPQGKWILNKDENPECPFCHHSFTYWGNFCSNCGSDMRKGDTK